MAARSHARSVDGLIVSLARHGIVTNRQLAGAGITHHHVASRRADGRLVERYRGIYQVGPVLTDGGRLRAAWLAAGPAAALSHVASSFIYGLRADLPPDQPWVTIPPGRVVRRPGLMVVRSSLQRVDVRWRDGIRVTSPPRTVLDNARILAVDDLEQMVAEAHFRRIAREEELLAQLRRNPGKPGNRKLRAVLDLPGGAQRLRSPAERDMLRLLRSRGIRGFECNARVHGYEVDFLWLDLGVALEVDGYDAHSGRRAFERDRVKAAALQARGVTVMPVTGRRIRTAPDAVIADLEATLRTVAVRFRRQRRRNRTFSDRGTG